MGARPYFTGGFRLDGPIENGDIVYMPQAAVKVTKGQVAFDDGSGFTTNVGTAFAATFQGVYGADSDNSAGIAGALSAMIIKPNSKNLFWVPNGVATVAAATDRGEIIDLHSNSTVDVTDNTVVAWGFVVDEIDISAEALANNAGGFVKGRFWPQPQ